MPAANAGALFNAHCHLELSHLKGKLRGGRPFPEWLQDIIRLKLKSTPEESTAAAREGIRRMRETGTVALLDILSMDTAEQPILEAVRDGDFSAILFREVAGFGPAEAQMRLAGALQRQRRDETPLPIGALDGLSPHSPYTVVPELFRLAARHAADARQWLCIHAAEVAEETEMLLHGRGPMREFLDPWLAPGWKHPGLRPIEYLDLLGCLGPMTLLAHCNDVTDGDLQIIRRSGASVVVCPGTHVYFERGAFPLPRLLAAGIPTFLGTDSLASNEDLDMNREIELAHQLCGGKVPHETIAALADAERAAVFFSKSRP